MSSIEWKNLDSNLLIIMHLSTKVLLLNYSYEPLLVITAKKAILMYFTDKVEVLEKSEKFICSAYMTFYIPSIIRLNKFVYVKKKNLSLTRKNIFQRDIYSVLWFFSFYSN